MRRSQDFPGRPSESTKTIASTSLGNCVTEEDSCFDARLRSDAFYGWSGGIGFRGEYEENFVILMIEFAEGNEVLLKAGLGAAAGTDDGGARRVKTRVHHGAALGVSEPQHTLRGQI